MNKGIMHLRAEYLEYKAECIEKGEIPWLFRDYIFCAYYWQFEDSLGD